MAWSKVTIEWLKGLMLSRARSNIQSNPPRRERRGSAQFVPACLIDASSQNISGLNSGNRLLAPARRPWISIASLRYSNAP